MVTIIAYICTIGILGLYATSRIVDNARIFDWANAVFFLPLTLCNMAVGASWAAVISFTFGIIAVFSLLRDVGSHENWSP